jgi:hypothetical protein
MSESATASNASVLPQTMLAEIERRRAGLARHMARAVVTLVRWDDSTGRPPRPEAIARACAAGLDLFLATAREGRPATARELREVAQLGILQARGSQSVEPVLSAYRIAARVAWDAILRAWRQHGQVTPEAMVVTANYVFGALDQVAAEVTRTYLQAREQHLLRGTRARTRLFHALISDTFDSELALQKQAVAVSLPIAGGYVAVVLKLIAPATDPDRGGEALPELLAQLELPARAIAHTTDPNTLVVLWPADSGVRARGLGIWRNTSRRRQTCAGDPGESASGPAWAATTPACAASRAHTWRPFKRSKLGASCGRRWRSTITTRSRPTWSSSRTL